MTLIKRNEEMKKLAENNEFNSKLESFGIKNNIEELNKEVIIQKEKIEDQEKNIVSLYKIKAERNIELEKQLHNYNKNLNIKDKQNKILKNKLNDISSELQNEK